MHGGTAERSRQMTFRGFAATFVALSAVSVGAQQPTGRPGETAADYVVGAADVLVITSYDQADLSGTFAVEADGTFTYPMLGRIEAGGMTLRGVEAMLKGRLISDGFFKDPQITVAVERYGSQRVFVLGEVRRPGVYPLSGPMRLVEALALADSTLPTAGSEIVIIPAEAEGAGDGNQGTVRVDLDDLESGGESANVRLHDGDTVLVPRAENVYVFGHVKNPGAYPQRQNDMTVLQALSLAGGLTDRGAIGRIEIVRQVDGEPQEIRADLTDVVQPGDTIIVPQRFF